MLQFDRGRFDSARKSPGRLRRRAWPVAVSLLVLATGMAFTLLWGPLVRHHPTWVFSGDIWGAYRSAHYIAWGALGSVYAAGTSLVTFPGILLLFAPMAMLTGSLGMTESFPFFVPHPTAWLLLGPYEILIGCTALFACDALAERLGLPRGRRALLCVVEGVAVWPVLVLWGHPEDALAVALAVYALVFAVDGRWTGVGWLFGAALATQPLVVLMLPVLLAMAGRSRAAGLLVRTFLPAIVLLATPLVAEFSTTVHALVDQPNFPRLDHATPWTALAPKLGGRGINVAVAAGPGRMVAVVAACLLGWVVRRWRARPDVMVWAAAAALALRCLTESVMVSYYLWPVVAIALVLALRADRRHLAVAVAVAAAVIVTVSSQTRFGEWPWWALTNGGLAILLAAAIPARTSRLRAHVPMNVDAAVPEPFEEHSPGLVGATK